LLTAVYAASAMLIQNILGVLMTQAEARNRGWLTGILDSFGWIAAIVTTSISINAINGHSLSTKILVIAAVTLSNLFGSLIGVWIGKKYIRDPAGNPVGLIKRRSSQARWL
jgi:hypothetical protein